MVGRHLGGYVLEALLGVGGMAEVYRAHDEKLDREVAIKVLPAALATDPGYVQRFRTEAKRFAALDHPHVVPVYHFDDEGSLLYLVMPILKESLRDRLRREGRLAPKDAGRLVGEVASALEVAHRQGLVHRDVKPENILLDESGTALLTDFGIARRVNVAREGGAQTLSDSGLPVGTPEYMAPEQLRNDPVDQRADIYALGAVLYELLAGVPPHTAESPYEVAALVLTAPLVPPSARAAHIWPALEQVILTALARLPEERYQDAASFVVALQVALAAPEPQQEDQPALTRRSIARRLSRPLALGVAEDGEIDQAPTVPAITIVRPAVSARVLNSLRRQRVALAMAVGLLLLTALGGATLVLAGGFGSGRGGMRTVILPGQASVITATPQPSTTASTQGSPAAQTQTPRPTAPGAAPPLTITPTPLLLLPEPQNTHTCSATQTITNNTAQSLGWAWQKPAAGGFHFQIDGGPQVDWPSDGSPGIAPGAHDTLTAISDCKPQPQSFAILMTDTHGNQYTFVLQVQ
jgi:serine/threonine-protein kinase